MSGVDIALDNPRELLSKVILPELTGKLGESVFALIVGFAVLGMLYYAADGRWSVPAVVLTLSGAWLTGQVPAQFAGLAQSLVIVGLIGGIFAIAERFYLRPTA
jgi:hypothetical protein